jgi:hypothetical protein
VSTLNKLVDSSNSSDDLIIQEKKLEDQAVETDFIYQDKIKSIIKEWAANLEEQHKTGQYPSPLNTISSYIKARLRNRHAYEGTIHYISKCLESKFKDPKYNSRPPTEYEFSYDDDMTVSLPIEESGSKATLFLDQDITLREIKTLPDLYKMTSESPTQATLVIKEKLSQLDHIKKVLKEQAKDLVEFAKTYNLRIAPIPVRKEKPPEQFRGQSEMSDLVEEIGDIFTVFGAQLHDVSQQMRDFKPNPQVREKVVKYFEKFVQELKPIFLAVNYIMKANEQMIRFNSDSKYAASEDYWFHIAFDNLNANNAHGAGVVNAMPTGQVLMEVMKGREEKIEVDEKGVVIFDVVREYTREDVTDQTKALLKKAELAAKKEPLQKALNAWAYNVVTVEHVGDPYEFFKNAVEKEYKRENISRETRDKLLSSPPTIFYEAKGKPKGRRVKEADIGPGKKYETLQIEHSSYFNIARRRQNKSEPFSRKA